jgi:predicted pyridoxine 5'-phosphate oxidase superfamily flavin-nucleotide-binding protein
MKGWRLFQRHQVEACSPATDGCSPTVGDVELPGSRGEHGLQETLGTVKRARAFYNNQVLDHVNTHMSEYLARQEMVFVSTADAAGNCDCSFRAGPPGFVRVLDPRTVAYPEYRGNGVMASMGNLTENPRIGLLFLDFFETTIGLHINGTAEVVENADMLPMARLESPGGPSPERWVVIDIEEAYIHCSKHVPHLMRMSKDIDWGTDDMVKKGGDFFKAKTSGAPWKRPNSSHP